MSTLPVLLRRSPHIFYGLAVIFAVWSIVNGWGEMSTYAGYGDPTLEGVMHLSKSKVLYQAILEGAYLVASGALIHVLLAVYDKLGAGGD